MADSKPTELFKFNDDITQATAMRATQWLVDNAEEMARRKAMMQFHEDRLRTIKAVAMTLSDQKAVSAKEIDAYQSDTYKAAIEEKRNAVFYYERLLNSKQACMATIDIWRTMEASLRRVI